jgi:polar amino acid transport system substrate-binding protein
MSGGEPYIIENLQGGEPGGFEGELAVYLGQQLGLPSRFCNLDWASMPGDLKRHDIDVILNGYEWSPARGATLNATIPYYIYRIRLIVRKDSPIRDWSDLQPGMRVGVLKDSAAERYLRDKYPFLDIEALDAEGTTGVMKLVVQKAHAATVQDVPAAVWYLQRRDEFPDLKMVGEAVAPVADNYYVLYTRPEDTELRDRLNDALLRGLEDGTLKRIYEKYGLWDADQERLPFVARTWKPEQAYVPPPFGWYLRLLGQGALVTVVLTCLAMPLAMLGGLLVALGRLYLPAGIRWLFGVYVEVIRGTPVLLQLIVIYYGLSSVGLSLPAFWAGVLGLAINYSAYEAENYRAGLLAIPSGQMEAALCLGMSRWSALCHIIVPQAVRLVVPPVTNDFIALFKDTSICSVIAVVELSANYRTLAVNHPALTWQVGALTALLYLIMSYPLSLLARMLERRPRPVV